MTTYLVNNTSDDTTAAATNAYNLSGSNNIIVTASGTLIATGANSDGLAIAGESNEATIYGLVYGTNDGIAATNAGDSVSLNLFGSVIGEHIGVALGANGSDTTSNFFITEGSTGIISGGTGAGIEAYGNASSITIDGQVYSSQGDGIDAESTGSTIYVGAGASIVADNGAGIWSLSSNETINGSVSGVAGLELGVIANVLIGATGSVSGTEYGVFLESGGDPDTLTIDNSGIIQGDDSGIYAAGTPGGVIVNNSGTISGAFGGIDFSSNSSDTIENSGTISGGILLGAADAVDNSGVILGGISGDGSITIDNDGKISHGIDLGTAGFDTVTNAGKVGGGITLGQYDSLTNTDGTIGGGLALAYGVGVINSGSIGGGIDGGGGDLIDNSGTITGAITDANAFSDGIINSGTIHGEIIVEAASLTNSGTVQAYQEGIVFITQSTLENSGTITGKMFFDGTSDTVTNDGIINGAVSLGGKDAFTNDGLIHGTLTTGAGDTLNLSTGSITGNIVASAGTDTFDFSGEFGHYKIAGFTTAGNHEIVNFASDDFTSYSELQSHMAQEGNNVVITLDASDDIILLNTKLANVLSHDFTFG